MTFKLPPLPYPYEALEPYVSRRTMELHHDKHHGAYVSKLNELIEGTPLAKLELEEIIRKTASDPAKKAVFNNAAQAWNHAFFWKCQKPRGGGTPTGSLNAMLKEHFGGLDGFRKKFLEAAVGQFGTGWAWLVWSKGRLEIFSTGDADTPIVQDKQCLLTCDVWEHAYYLDYQNRREEFVKAFLEHLIDWNHAAAQLERVQ